MGDSSDLKVKLHKHTTQKNYSAIVYSLVVHFILFVLFANYSGLNKSIEDMIIKAFGGNMNAEEIISNINIHEQFRYNTNLKVKLSHFQISYSKEEHYRKLLFVKF